MHQTFLFQKQSALIIIWVGSWAPFHNHWIAEGWMEIIISLKECSSFKGQFCHTTSIYNLLWKINCVGKNLCVLYNTCKFYPSFSTFVCCYSYSYLKMNYFYIYILHFIFLCQSLPKMLDSNIFEVKCRRNAPCKIRNYISFFIIKRFSTVDNKKMQRMLENRVRAGIFEIEIIGSIIQFMGTCVAQSIRSCIVMDRIEWTWHSVKESESDLTSMLRCGWSLAWVSTKQS